MPFPTPVGRQTDAIYLPERGHSVILGTAGSGKSVMAILRARYLADPLTPGHGRVLLATFNRALVTYLGAVSAELRLSNQIEVRNYHHVARGYLSRHNRMGWNDILSTERRLALITQAMGDVKADVPDDEIWRYPAQFFAEECKWIAGTGVTTADKFYELRGDRTLAFLTPSASEIILEVYQRYRTLRAATGCRYDWEDVAEAMEQTLAADQGPRYFRHVVIDEGQDFTPTMLRSLVAAIPADGSLTFFGDAAQQVYGSRISWEQAGLNLTRPIVKFQENYRNTREIANLCLAMTRTSAFRGMADLVTPNQPRAEGPLPVLVRCASPQKELEFTVQLARRSAEQQSVAILIRRHRDLATVLRALRPARVQQLHHDLNNWSSTGISVGTIFSAKGMEFDTVIVPFCGSDRVPDADYLQAFAHEEEGLAREARLLYVAMSRAKSRLIITATGSPTELLPGAPSLYQHQVRNT